MNIRILSLIALISYAGICFGANAKGSGTSAIQADVIGRTPSDGSRSAFSCVVRGAALRRSVRGPKVFSSMARHASQPYSSAGKPKVYKLPRTGLSTKGSFKRLLPGGIMFVYRGSRPYLGSRSDLLNLANGVERKPSDNDRRVLCITIMPADSN